MSKELDLQLEQDYIQSLTKVSGIKAVVELIWNSLDADATNIEIILKPNVIGNYSNIIIKDNGHGLNYNDAENIFQKLGGSPKSFDLESPNGRRYHGKEGKGRYSALGLGNMVTFESVYKDKDKFYKYNIIINVNNLKKSVINECQEIVSIVNSGFTVLIENIDTSKANMILSEVDNRTLLETFASYYFKYKNFKIKINNDILNFESLIKSNFEKTIPLFNSENKEYNFNIEIIEWKFESNKRTYFCDKNGIPYHDVALGIRSSFPISIFIKSDYIEELKSKNLLVLSEMDEFLNKAFDEVKKIAKQYNLDKLHLNSKEFIKKLKKDKIYPYLEEALDEIEIAKRQVFDIVALQLKEHLPSFDDNDNSNKKITLALIKEALEHDSLGLQRILTEVLGLPKEKKEELLEILDKTTLSNIIDTMNIITNRLKLLHSLELIIYDPDYSEYIKERKHLHKIVINETWIFGDEYTYGADDINLKNVLNQYLTYLGRENVIEIMESSDNNDLNTIPDICLWKQYNLGSYEKHSNLIIELKKPSVYAGVKELNQIETYAGKVSKDGRFPKENTKWTFILLVTDVKDEIEFKLNQHDRKYGHVVQTDNIDVFVVKWGTLISQAKAKYQYLKEKLNLNFENNSEAIDFLKTKYQKYLPDEFEYKDED